MSHTFAGTTLELVEAIPATYDQAGYEALTYLGGECALKSVPEISKVFATVDDAVVCKTTTTQKKGSASWNPVTYQLNVEEGDPAQDVYQDLFDDISGVGSFKLTYSTGDVTYWTAQVSQFNHTDGGDKDTLNMRSVTLLVQSDNIVFVEAP